MVDIDPLCLIKMTYLRCFGEVYQDKLVRFLKTFLYLRGSLRGYPPHSIIKDDFFEPKLRRSRDAGAGVRGQ